MIKEIGTTIQIPGIGTVMVVEQPLCKDCVFHDKSRQCTITEHHRKLVGPCNPCTRSDRKSAQFVRISVDQQSLSDLLKPIFVNVPRI